MEEIAEAEEKEIENEKKKQRSLQAEKAESDVIEDEGECDYEYDDFVSF
jgi:hypothetical protein